MSRTIDPSSGLMSRILTMPTLLRTAAVLSLLYCLGHMSGVPWTPGVGAGATAVVEQMRTVRFESEGANCAYWDFYVGFGCIVGAFLLVQAVSLWCIAGIARQDPRLAVPVVSTFLVGVLVNAYLAYRYFFAAPAAFSATIALLLVLSLWMARSQASPMVPASDGVAVE